MRKVLDIIIYGFVVAGLIALCFFTPFSQTWRIVFAICLSLTLVGLILGKFKFKKIYKPLIFVLILEAIIMICYLIFYYTGILQHFESLDSTRAWFESFGAWAWIIFFLVQLAQVIILPIPAQITTVAGALIFGWLKAFLISTVAVISGSLIAFGIGKIFGDKVAYKIGDKETVDKYKNVLTKKGLLLLPIMFLFPLFPDDLLCFIAGSTEMTWKYFVTVTLITRPIGILCTCLFLGGTIIPFSGWGIPVWIVLAILLIATCIFLLKYQEKITNWIIEKFGKKKKQYKNIKKDKEYIENENVESAEIIERQKENKDENYISFSNQNVANTQYEIAKETSTKQNNVKVTKKKKTTNKKTDKINKTNSKNKKVAK